MKNEKQLKFEIESNEYWSLDKETQELYYWAILNLAGFVFFRAEPNERYYLKPFKRVENLLPLTVI